MVDERSPAEKPISRRRLLQASAKGALALTGLSAGFSPFKNVYVRAQRTPVRIANLNDFSGVFRELTIDQTNGLQLAFDEVGNEVAGRPLELIRADTEANPSVGVVKLQEMVQRVGVDFVVGPISSAVAAAISSYVAENRLIWIISTAGNIENTGELCAPNIFRSSYNTYQVSYPFGQWVAKHVSDRVFTCYPNYAFGQQMNRFFIEGFEAAGGKVIGSVAPPLGTRDFSPYLSRIRAANPPAVWCSQVGADAVTVVKAFEEFGLKRNIQLLATTFTVMDTYLAAQGTAADGVLGLGHWARTLDNDRNRWFVRAYREKYGSYPSIYSLMGFDAGLSIVTALQATGGDTDLPSLIAALRNATLNSPRGPLTFDAAHNVITPVYVTEVRHVDGERVNVAIDDLGFVESPNFGCSMA